MPEATKTPTNEDYAYLAGLIDGEGCFVMKKISTQLQMRINIANTDYGMVKWIADYFGGCIWEQRHPKDSHRKTSYHCEIQTSFVRKNYRKIFKHLKTKKAQSQLMIEYFETIENKEHFENYSDERNRIKTKLNKLNKRGV